MAKHLVVRSTGVQSRGRVGSGVAKIAVSSGTWMLLYGEALTRRRK